MFRHLTGLIYSHRAHDGGNRELRHLYSSASLSIFALSIIGVFIPVYLYSLGFGIASIALFYVAHYLVRLLTSVPIAKLVNRFGVKHVMAASYILTFIKSLLLVSLPDIAWPLLLIAVVDGLDHVTFFIPYHTGISKLKTTKIAGKQLGVIYQWNKLAGALGPFLGGLIAYQFGIGYALLTTAVLVGASIIPLTLSPEPVRDKQELRLSRLPWSKIRWDLVGVAGLSFNQLSTEGLWALFLGVYIFTQDTYLGLGLISSLGLLVAILSAHFLGRLVDAHRGRSLLRVSAVVQSASHGLRLILNSTPMAYIFNLANKPSEVGLSLPFRQGYMVRGDELAKFRILYMAVIEMANYVAKIVAWLVVFVIASAGHEKLSLQVIFVLAIPATLLVMSERFGSLKSRPS